MNSKQLHEYALLYPPYNKNPKWVEWFAKVAPLKIARSIKILSQYKKKEAKVLDFGCGIGFNVYYLAKIFPNVIGVDVDKPSIEIARNQLKKLKCNKKVLHYNGKLLPFKKNSFDIVCANDVWEHTQDPRRMMKEIYRVMNPNGILLINTPNKLWPIETHYQLPFLSYLPYSIANRYVKIMKKANRYDDIHLPTYGTFKKSVEEFFKVKDITFDLVKDYKKNKLGEERGMVVALIGNFFQMIEPLEKIPVLSFFYVTFIAILNRLSMGWYFLAWPKKN